MNEQDFHHHIMTELENGSLAFPALPDIALKVRELINSPTVTATDLSELIKTDADLSTRLIHVANSAMYRRKIQVESVQVAIARLGLSMVQNMVTSLAMYQMFQPGKNRIHKRLHELWEHSIQVSVISQTIAHNLPTIKTDEAMLAGLIHDIGVIPLLMQAEAHPELAENSKVLDQLIENLHPRIGEAVLRDWNFPENMISVAAEHENLNRNSGVNGPDLTDVVQVANLKSYSGTNKALDPVTLAKVKAFRKCGVDLGISVTEIDENSEEYAETLTLFTQQKMMQARAANI